MYGPTTSSSGHMKGSLICKGTVMENKSHFRAKMHENKSQSRAKANENKSQFRLIMIRWRPKTHVFHEVQRRTNTAIFFTIRIAVFFVICLRIKIVYQEPFDWLSAEQPLHYDPE